uniref:Uncharacterized protein n=1 Tax=Thalassionema nitzschioides TaxID=33649 RepID=A0A7S1E0L9_9STRA
MQQYAGLQVSRARALQQQEEGDDKSKSADELFEKLLACDTENWNQEIVKGTSEVSPSSLVAAIQKTMETVILGLENGTMSQRIQAEYLKELVDRVEALKQSKA